MLCAIGLKRLKKDALIEFGSPWANGYVESFNGKLRNKLLVSEIIYTLPEAKIMFEKQGHHYNEVEPRKSLNYKPLTSESIVV